MLHLLAASAALVAASANDDTTSRWYDLRPILAASASTPPGIDLRLHLTSSWIDNLEPDSYDLPLGRNAALTEDVCVQMIRKAIEAEGAADLRGITRGVGHIKVTGNDAAQGTAWSALQALRAAALDSVVVEVYRVRDSELAGEPDAVLDVERAAALLERIDVGSAYRQSVRIGRSAGLGDQEVTSFLHDYDVEVAQGAVAADPTVSMLRTGFEVGLRVERASDGSRFVVRTWGRDGRVAAEMQRIELPSLGRAPLELPTVATSLWTSSALVPPGGAMLIDHDGGGAEALIVRIAPDGPSTTPSSVLPLGELGTRPMQPSIPTLSAVAPSGGWPSREDDFSVPSWEWTSFLSTFTETVEDIRSGHASRFGSSVVFGEPERITSELTGAVEELRSSLSIRTIALDVRYGIMPSKAARTETAADDLAPLAEALPGRLLGSGIENDAVLLVGGTEYAYLKDHDTLIAAGSVVADPIVDAAFEGIALWCMPMSDQAGGLSAWFDVQAHAPAPDARDLTASSYRPGPNDGSKDSPGMTGRFVLDLALQLPVTRRAAARTLVESQSGEWTVVTTRPLSGSDETLVVLARMTRL
ncbi:MAG: hypothetical protein AAGI22_15375 [Planctomycetota bacterium]